MSVPGLVLVLVTRGKREACDSASVHAFDTLVAAMVFCASVGKEGRYWTHARVVADGQEMDLDRDEWWCDYCQRTANDE